MRRWSILNCYTDVKTFANNTQWTDSENVAFVVHSLILDLGFAFKIEDVLY